MYQIRPITPAAGQQKKMKMIGRPSHTNFELPACWNAQSGYLLESTAVMIAMTTLPIAIARNGRTMITATSLAQRPR